MEFLALVTAVLVLAGAWFSWSTRRQVKEVHVMVNSQRDVMMERMDQLADALIAADVAVPLPKPHRSGDLHLDP